MKSPSIAVSKVARAMLRQRLTVSAVAALLGVSAPSMSRILNGKQNPRAALQLRIFEVFGVPVTDWPQRPLRTGRYLRSLAREAA